MAVKIVMVLLMLGIGSAVDMQAQTKAQLIQQADSAYQSNILKSRLNGVYIPKDLEDAFLELDRLSPKDALDKIKAEDENYIARKLHFGLGRWMSYNWNFDEGSRFSHYLKELGLFHSEDMIDFMLISYHRYLNQRPQQIEERVKIYRTMREKQAETKVKTQ